MKKVLSLEGTTPTKASDEEKKKSNFVETQTGDSGVVEEEEKSAF